ncbi:bcl-2-related protein A1-like [Oscarella lobularis]|uniref:bcl-2-related protein A1-like n=1 Tax=Oscarella lobularis TaxID=121494 RepID=UPI0033141FE7
MDTGTSSLRSVRSDQQPVVTPNPSTDEQVEEVTNETIHLVLAEQQRVPVRDIETRTGIRLSGDESQRIVTQQVADCILTIVDELEKDPTFVFAVDELDVGSESSAYSAFVDVALRVCGIGTRGITWYRIVALLAFAAKLAAKVLRDPVGSVVGIVRMIKDWVIQFVRDYLAQWISISGGWAGIRDVAENIQKLMSSGWRRYKYYATAFAGGTLVGVGIAYFLLKN